MKTTLIALLVVLNVGLLAALMLGTGTDQAQAQVLGASNSYVATTLKYAEGQSATVILDIRQRKLAAIRLVPVNDELKLQEVQGRDLDRDFANSN